MIFHDGGLRDFQEVHKVWLDHNFPNQNPHDALLGLAEEIGELAEAGRPIPRELSIALGKLAHAHLKHEQGIRGVSDYNYQRDASDAIGDIMIYLASYCNTNGFDMASCLENAWEEVSARDWQKYPETGGANPDAEQSTG